MYFYSDKFSSVKFEVWWNWLLFCVTLCRLSTKQTIPCLFWHETRQRVLDPRSRRDQKWWGDASQRVRQRDWEVGSWQGTRTEESTRDSRETSRHERGSRPVKKDRVKMNRHSSCFVEVSLEIHASVSLYMLSGMQRCYIASLLHLSKPQAFCSFFLFSPVPSIVFDVAVKKCALPLSEPLVYHRP